MRRNTRSAICEIIEHSAIRHAQPRLASSRPGGRRGQRPPHELIDLRTGQAEPLSSLGEDRLNDIGRLQIDAGFSDEPQDLPVDRYGVQSDQEFQKVSLGTTPWTLISD
jgi:hypothetical protein